MGLTLSRNIVLLRNQERINSERIEKVKRTRLADHSVKLKNEPSTAGFKFNEARRDYLQSVAKIFF